MASKKPQTRLQAKAAKAGRIVTGPKGSKPQSTTNAAIQRQGNKITRGGLGSGRPSGTVSQTRSKPVGTSGGGVSKPSGTAKMVNAEKPTMRMLRAKAQTLRQQTQNPTPRGQGKAVTMPNSAKQGVNLPKTGARVLRQQAAGTTSPAAQARAAAQGQAIRKAAELKRSVRAASQGMSRTLQNARVARSVGGKLLGKVAVPAAIAQEIQTMGAREKRMQALRQQGIERRAKATAAKQGNTSKFAGARSAAVKKAQAIKGSPVVGSKSSKPSSGGGSLSAGAKSFDRAFAAARKSGVKQFTWRGKKYTTKMKGE